MNKIPKTSSIIEGNSFNSKLSKQGLPYQPQSPIHNIKGGYYNKYRKLRKNNHGKYI